MREDGGGAVVMIGDGDGLMAAPCDGGGGDGGDLHLARV